MFRHQRYIMNIGFDAKRAFQNTTGLGNYSRTLISSLAGYFPENKYFLFTPDVSDLFNPIRVGSSRTIVPSSPLFKIFRSAWRSKFITKDIAKSRIEVYHGLSNEIPFGIHCLPVKKVVTIHDLIFERYPRQYNPIDVYTYRKKALYACRNADRIIAVSEQTKKDIISFYRIPAGKISVVYQSCDPVFSQRATDFRKNDIRLKYHLPEEFLLYVGSVVKRKNLLTLVNALQLLPGNIPLIIVGSGHHYQHLVKASLQVNKDAHPIRWLCEQHPVPKNDLAVIYTTAKMLIYPSIFEGFGLPIQEALRSGTPVITSIGSCFAETGGDAALYVNPLDKNEIANAIYKLSNDGNLRKKMILKGIKYTDKSTPFIAASRVTEIYHELLNKKKGYLLPL